MKLPYTLGEKIFNQINILSSRNLKEQAQVAPGRDDSFQHCSGKPRRSICRVLRCGSGKCRGTVRRRQRSTRRRSLPRYCIHPGLSGSCAHCTDNPSTDLVVAKESLCGSDGVTKTVHNCDKREINIHSLVQGSPLTQSPCSPLLVLVVFSQQ